MPSRFLSFTRVALAAVAPVVLSLAACSSSTPASAAVVDSGVEGCDGQGDTYTANLAKPGTQGVYTFTLVQASPAPPALDANVWTLKITDKSGAPPALSQVAVTPFMPLMGHGSDQVPILSANADGTFAVQNVFLFMSGLWTVTVAVDATADAGAKASATPTVLDQAVYTFCVD